MTRLRGLDLRTPDGSTARLSDALFDDATWDVRAFVAETGGWITARRVLLAPQALGNPDAQAGEATADLRRTAAVMAGDPPWRSVREVTGYNVEAEGEEIGEVEDFLFDESGWVARYLVVDTGGWLSGRRVLVAPPWVRHIRWEDGLVTLDLSRDRIRQGPAFDPGVPVDRTGEEELHRHHRRPPYWGA